MPDREVHLLLVVRLLRGTYTASSGIDRRAREARYLRTF